MTAIHPAEKQSIASSEASHAPNPTNDTQGSANTSQSHQSSNPGADDSTMNALKRTMLEELADLDWEMKHSKHKKKESYQIERTCDSIVGTKEAEIATKAADSKHQVTFDQAFGVTERELEDQKTERKNKRKCSKKVRKKNHISHEQNGKIHHLSLKSYGPTGAHKKITYSTHHSPSDKPGKIAEMSAMEGVSFDAAKLDVATLKTDHNEEKYERMLNDFYTKLYKEAVDSGIENPSFQQLYGVSTGFFVDENHERNLDKKESVQMRKNSRKSHHKGKKKHHHAHKGKGGKSTAPTTFVPGAAIKG